MLSSILHRSSAKIAALDLTSRERPPLQSVKEELVSEARTDSGLLEEYSRLSKELGITNPHIDADLKVEAFKAFLRQKDWAIFSLQTVTAYMDVKAAEESAAKAGWHWRPLRAKDDIRGARFGMSARVIGDDARSIGPASDYYQGPHKERVMGWSNSRQGYEQETSDIPSSGEPYDKLVPIHALRKVAVIEKEYPDQVSFFVCDYAPAPHIEHPDPFLMAVVNNARLDKGVGRFIIDFWDEPGFGLDQMLE